MCLRVGCISERELGIEGWKGEKKCWMLSRTFAPDWITFLHGAMPASSRHGNIRTTISSAQIGSNGGDGETYFLDDSAFSRFPFWMCWCGKSPVGVVRESTPVRPSTSASFNLLVSVFYDRVGHSVQHSITLFCTVALIIIPIWSVSS